MYKPLFTLLIAACLGFRPAIAQDLVHYDSTWAPASFEDPLRVEKIKKLLPAIDSIYKKFANDNHYRGWYSE